jgi:DNA-directed RNA polymerase specialized sigma24 family protein
MNDHIIHNGHMNNGRPYEVIDGKRVNVRKRVYCEYHNITLKPDERIILTCKVPRCINPLHMEIIKVNDLLNKVRRVIPMLSEYQREIIFLSDKTDKELAEEFNVPKSTINRIRTRRTRACSSN